MSRWTITDPQSVRDVVEVIDKFGLRVVFVVDNDRHLRASVPDGDVRRALLAGHGLDSPAEAISNANYIALPDGGDWARAIAEGDTRGLRDYPVVDADGRLVCVEVHRSDMAAVVRNNTVVIMAGGEGTRLRPLTTVTPKPLLHVAGEPILQHIIKKLRDEGFSDVILAINYLGEQIESYFEDGSRFGVKIRYLRENRALGTAGALSLMNLPFASPIVVMNGDLVLAANVGKMVDYHVAKQAEITVGAKLVETAVPFGVLSTRGSVVTGIEEKPTHRDLVNAGVYVLSSKIVSSVSAEKATDMPDLILENIGQENVLAYPMHETWADLGRPDDFSRADEIFKRG